MGYNGLAKEFKKRWGKDKTPDADEAAQEAPPGRAAVADGAAARAPQDWREDAQDRISALLEEVVDDAADETIDLAAIRRALVKEAAASVAEDAASEEAADEQDEVRPLIIDEILLPEAPDEASSAVEASVEESDETPDAEPTLSASSPKAAVMGPMFKDPVVAEMLDQGAVSLPQALAAVRRQPEQPDRALWRILADLSSADRGLIYEQAAGLLGFETIDVDEKCPADVVQAAMERWPQVRDHLFTFKLLPLKCDPETSPPRLILATPDPSHPGLQVVLEALDAVVELYFAPEDVVLDRLEEARALLDRGATSEEAPAGQAAEETAADLDLLLDGDAAPAAEAATPETEKDKIPVNDVLRLTREDADFLELHWEPFDEEEPPAEVETTITTEEPASAKAAKVEWQSLARLVGSGDDLEPSAQDAAPEPEEPSAAGFDFTPEELTKLGQPDRRSTDEVRLNDAIASELLDDFSGNHATNGEAHKKDTPSFDGSAPELPDHIVADWTKQDETQGPPVPPPEEASTVKEASKLVEEKVDDLRNIDIDKIRAKDRVVAMLLRKEIVSVREIKQAQQKQQEEQLKEPLWRVLALIDSVNRAAIFAEAASVYAFRTAELRDGKPDPEFARSVMETFDEDLRGGLLKLRVVPFEVDLDQQTGAIKVVFITHDPTRPDVHRMMQKLRLERFELRYAPESIVTALILEAFPRRNEFLERLDEQDAFDLGTSYDETADLIDEEALEAEINRSKLINLFEATLVEAVRQDASDVHIWPNARKQVEIHFRIDGRLRRWHVEDKVHPEAFIAVIKDNSMNVDRFEREAAQDGFIQRWIDEALIRFRVSVLPIANVAQDVRSESIVIRVLDDRKVVKDLSKLGLNDLALERFRRAISQPHGMVILTGPTGSGKTTTLYASLHEVINPEVNVLTVEDPVEYILPGVRQIKLNNKLGLDGALRSILRHDPDIVMVGEMRDRATAELAIKLANTGHLTFSTLHTNDAASAVTRLYKMDIEPFLIAYAINLVVAQRLIRRLCPTCKKIDPDPDYVLLRKLGFSEKDIEASDIYMQVNDPHCPTCKGVGFKGRRAVSEAMYFSRELRHLIADSDGILDEGTIKNLAAEQGMMTLVDSAREVVKEGDSSILEMMRVVSTEE